MVATSEANGYASGGILVPGFEAGLLGGAGMAAWMIASAVLGEFEPLDPLRPLGDTFAGPDGRGGGAGPLVYGLALHMLVSGALGVLFMAVLPRDFPPGSAAVMCVGFTFLVMSVMSSLLLPAVNPSLRAEMRELGGSWVLAHAAYGACVGFFGQRLRQRGRAHVPARVRPRTV